MGVSVSGFYLNIKPWKLKQKILIFSIIRVMPDRRNLSFFKIIILDFYIFLILFMAQQYFLPELLDKNIDDMMAFMYVADKNENKTREIDGMFLFNYKWTSNRF